MKPIYVYYQNELWQVMDENTRETYLIDRRDVNPNYVLKLQLVRNPRIKREVLIKKIKFQFEH